MTFPTLNSSRTSRFGLISSCLFCIVFCISSNAHAEETLGPPTLGEQTKGKPAINETELAGQAAQELEGVEEVDAQSKEIEDPLGTTTVTEHKRESGQVYLIELEHSLGAKQYLYENDSDGQIGSSIEDNESIKEIPKWKIGSW